MDVGNARLALQGYTQGKDLAARNSVESQAARAVASFSDTLRQNEDVVRNTMISSADPHALVQALAQTELAVETTVVVRNKVVEAYQEIMRMPI